MVEWFDVYGDEVLFILIFDFSRLVLSVMDLFAVDNVF